MGADYVEADSKGISGYRKQDAGSEDAVFPEFTRRRLDNSCYVHASDAHWLGQPLDGVIRLKSNCVRKYRTPIKLGRGRCASRQSRFMQPVKSVSSLESCLRAQIVDTGLKEVRRDSSSPFPSFPGEEHIFGEIPFTGFNELMPCLDMHSDLHLSAFVAGHNHTRNIKSGAPDTDSRCLAARSLEETFFNHHVKDVKTKTLRGRRKLSGDAGDVVEGRIIHTKGTTSGTESLSSQERQKMLVLNKKRKASYRPTSMLCGLANASGLDWEVLLFSLGLGVGMILMLEANRNGVEGLSQKLIEAEKTVKGLQKQLESRAESVAVRNISCSSEIRAEDPSLQRQNDSLLRINYASSDCIPAPDGFSEMALSKGDGPSQSFVTNASADLNGSIAELEAEFEAEMEILQLNLANECPFYQHQSSDVSIVQLDHTVDLVQGDLNIGGLAGPLDLEEYDDSSSGRLVQPAKWAVSPRDLDRRLHILLQTRQEERILGLEAELKAAESNLAEKESLLQTWKARVHHLIDLLHSPASGDESTSVTNCTHIRIAGQLDENSTFGYRNDRIENILCNLADDYDCFHSTKNVNMNSHGNSHNYTVNFVSSDHDDSERKSANPMENQIMAFKHSKYGTMRTSILGSGGATIAAIGEECHATLQATTESSKYSKVEREIDKITDVQFCCMMKPSDDIPVVSEEPQLPVHEGNEYSNVKLGTGSTLNLGIFDDSPCEGKSKSNYPQRIRGEATVCSCPLNTAENPCWLRFSEEGCDHNSRWRSSSVLSAQLKSPLFKKSTLFRGSADEDKNLGFKAYTKARNPSLSIEDIGISRYDIGDQQYSFNSYGAAPANTPIEAVSSMRFSHSALQSEICSSKMANVYEKMRYWEELSKKEHNNSRKLGPELTLAPDQGTLCHSSQADQIFPVSFSCSESNFSWDESSATETEEQLGDILIKRIVEKTRRRSNAMRDAQPPLTELGNKDTFCNRESCAQEKLDPESSWNCQHNLNTRFHEGEERDKTPVGLNLMTPYNSLNKSTNACRSLIKA